MSPIQEGVTTTNNSVDFELLESLEGLAADEFPTLIQRYLHDAEKYIETMDNAYWILSFQELFDAAHSFKGSSGTLAANYLYEFCCELEQACLESSPSLRKIGHLLNAIQMEFERVKMALLHYCNLATETQP